MPGTADILLATILTGLIGVIVLLIMVARKSSANPLLTLQAQLTSLGERLDRNETLLREEMTLNRAEFSRDAGQARRELNRSLVSLGKSLGNALGRRIADQSGIQKERLETVTQRLHALNQTSETKLELVRKTLHDQIRALQNDNHRQLEMMRSTVDEKLQTTLETRLGQSFQQVSQRLEQVHQALGEMHHLASGVGDLKNVLTNVKTRGVWGEIRLGHILEEILTPDQYGTNIATKRHSSERVEFAVKMPGIAAADASPVWLPIDAKFPLEDYQRLIDAREAGERARAERHIKALTTRIKTEAKNINQKYLDPPHTIDFGIMFLPVEGLYAEVLQQPGLTDVLQREYRIVIAGPVTLAALLNSLQMGFRSLAIERRSSEVWMLLGQVKAEFSKFSTVLAKTKKKLQEASNTIGQAEVRTRAIERKLSDVEHLPGHPPSKAVEQ